MMKSLKIQLFVVSICIIFGLSIITGSAVARPIEPITYDYAEFRNDPYPEGTYTMTIYYRHDSYCNMYIYLYNPNDYQVKTWVVDRYDRSGYKYYTASHTHGVWRLQCYMSGYQPYWTDAALLHKFAIPDPEPEQENLGEDWARHPQNQDIYEQALTIIGQASSSYAAAQKIYYHVVSHFVHDYEDITFRSDLDLLDDLNTYGHYYGVCRSDSVILTAYARALGIPARIIHLHAHWVPTGGVSFPDDEHYFAEFYVSYCGSYQWVPVDGDPVYDWFGISEANWRISECWPYEVWIGGRLYGWRISISIVTEIPYGYIVDSGYYTDDYPNHPYRNDL